MAYAGADVHVHQCIEKRDRIYGVEGRAIYHNGQQSGGLIESKCT